MAPPTPPSTNMNAPQGTQPNLNANAPVARWPPNVGTSGYETSRVLSRSQQPRVPEKEPERKAPKTPTANRFTEMMASEFVYIPPRDIGPRTPDTPHVVRNGVFPEEDEGGDVSGISAAEHKIVEKRVRLIYTSNMQILSIDVEKLIAPNLKSNSARMALLQKQAAEQSN